VYDPLPSQKTFHASEARFKGFSGPIGCGKSQALCQEAIRLSYMNPGRLGLLGAPTYPMLRDATCATLFEILDKNEIPFEHNKAENTVILGDTGSRILFRPVDEFERLRGTNLAWFGLDELTYTQEAAWLRLTARLQCGEVLWWYFANGSGMAYYDDDTQSAFQTAYGRPLARFLTPNDDPSLNGFVDANFLRSRLASYVRGIHTYVAGRHPGVWFELLWPLDVNLPETKRLNWYVNLPPAWMQKTGSEFASFVCEGFQFGGIDRNVDEVARCAAYPFAELKWSSSDCGYLMGLFNPGWPWEREFLASRRQRPSVVKMWAYDQICLYGRGVPLPSESRTSTLTDGSE